MNLLIFLDKFKFVQDFLTFSKIPASKKYENYNLKTVSSMIRKNLDCNMEYFYKNVFRIHNVSIIFENFEPCTERKL